MKVGINPGIAFTALVIVVGVVCAVMSEQLGFGTLKQPGSGAYPFGMSMLMLALGALVLRSQLREHQVERVFPVGGLKVFLLMVLVLVGWLTLLNSLGFSIVTFLATLAMSKIMGLRGWWAALALAAGTTLFVYLLFGVWFYTDLPRGILG